MTNVAVCSYLNLAVFHIKGGNTWASGTEGLRCVHLPSPHTPSAWGHPSLPGRGRAEPPLLGNTRQESPGNTKQKSLVLGAAGPEKPPQKASPGMPAIPTIAMGLPFLVSLKLPSREPGCGRVLALLVHSWEVGGGARVVCGRGAYLPMHVRPSEWRAYFWWQPHMGPVSVSSQLCWQPPFP